jgi:hypothetical protein
MIRLIFAAVFSIFALGLSISPVYGQKDDNRFGTPGSGNWNMEDLRLKAQLTEIKGSIPRGPDGPSNFDLEHGKPDISHSRRVLATAQAEKILQPTRSERATYAQFLKQPHVGLVRLTQRAGVVSVDELSKDKPKDKPPVLLMIPGGGAFYSFTTLTHLPGDWAEIKLNDGNLEVAFGPAVLGALTILGDIPIDSLTTSSPGVSTLATYARPLEGTQASSDRERFRGGITLAGYPLQTQVPVHENTTYALRSIAYGRSDLLVAVRIVQQDDDGSVLFLWKRIDKFSTPKLKAAARE